MLTRRQENLGDLTLVEPSDKIKPRDFLIQPGDKKSVRLSRLKSRPSEFGSSVTKSFSSRAPNSLLSRRFHCTSRALGLLVSVVVVTGCSHSSSVDPERRDSADSPDAAGPTSNSVPVIASLITDRMRQLSAQLDRTIDPNNGRWAAEALTDRVNQRLVVLANVIEREAIEDEATRTLGQFTTPQFKATSLRPMSILSEVYHTGSIRVRRSQTKALAANLDEIASQSLSESLVDLREFLQGERRVSLKVFRISAVPESAQFTTEIRVEGDAKSKSARRQFRANWNCEWSQTGDSLQLNQIQLTEYEEVEFAIPDNRPDQPLLADCTSAVLGSNASFSSELCYGMDYWVNRIDRRLMVSRFGHHGLAIGDVNADGLDDLYVCNPGGLRNRLYVQQPDGSATDRSIASGVDFLDYTSSTVIVDLDNDNDQDMVVATPAALVILENDGQGRFSPAIGLPKCQRAFSLAVADYDQDGLLDIYACRYRTDSTTAFELPLPVPYYDAENGGRNFLFRNLGGLKFKDVTDDAGLNEANTRFSFAAAWEDFDDDGDMDLYVANDYGRNCLYRNQNGIFANVADSMGVEDLASGMSVSWSDYDHDGAIDLYISNMFSSAGNRIAFQPQFQQPYSTVQSAQIQRHARGNSLFQAQRTATKSGPFRDVSVAAQATMGRWAWGSLFADINNDSWDDLIVANGLMTTDDTGDL